MVEHPQVVRTCGVFTMLTSKCAFAPKRPALLPHPTSKSDPSMWCFLPFWLQKYASRDSGVTFFNMSTTNSAPNPSVFTTFDVEMCFAPQRRALFQHLNFQKWSEAEASCIVLHILTSKCASRHNSVHFCHILISKSAPKTPFFTTVDFELCFAPQRRALFQHLNFQKCSEPSEPIRFLPLLTKCASRHSAVQLFISHLPRWLCARRFSTPTFRPSGATKHWKNIVFRDFSTFSRKCIFFLLILSLL